MARFPATARLRLFRLLLIVWFLFPACFLLLLLPLLFLIPFLLSLPWSHTAMKAGLHYLSSHTLHLNRTDRKQSMCVFLRCLENGRYWAMSVLSWEWWGRQRTRDELRQTLTPSWLIRGVWFQRIWKCFHHLKQGWPGRSPLGIQQVLNLSLSSAAP